MKTVLIILILLPLLIYALSRLYLYIVNFSQQKCKCCPFSSGCSPAQKMSCTAVPASTEKKNF